MARVEVCLSVNVDVIVFLFFRYSSLWFNCLLTDDLILTSCCDSHLTAGLWFYLGQKKQPKSIFLSKIMYFL